MGSFLRTVVLRRLRHALLLGPWNPWVCRALQFFAKTRSKEAEAADFAIDVDQLADTLSAHGVSDRFVLPSALLQDLVAEIGSLPEPPLTAAHERLESVGRLARQAAVREVARRYLGVEPIISDSAVVSTKPRPGAGVQPENRFHFDASDWRAASLWVYLTDVDDDCFPHSYVEGTHGVKHLSDVLRRFADDDATERRFPGKIRRLTGPAGTAFFEDLSIWHRRVVGTKPRLALVIHYTIARRERRPPAAEKSKLKARAAGQAG